MAVVRISNGNNTGTVAVSTTKFFTIGGYTTTMSTTETTDQVVTRVAGTLSDLFINVITNTLTATTTARTRKNTANGGQSVSIGTGATGIFEDLTNTDAVVAADKINFQVVAGGTGTSIVITILAVNFSATTNTTKRYLNGTNLSPLGTASTTFFIPFGGQYSANTTEASTQYKTRVAGTIANLLVHVSANARTTASTLRDRKNTANGAMSVSVGSTATGFFEDNVNTDTVVSGDLINYSGTTGTGTGNLTTDYIAAEMTTTNSTFFFLVANCVTIQNQAVTGLYVLEGAITNASPETKVELTSRVVFTAGNLQTLITANTVTAPSTLTFRQNAGSTTLTLSITASTTGYFEDVVDTVSIVATDLLNYQLVSGTGGTSMSIGLIAITASPTAAPATAMGATLMMMGVG